MSRDRRDGPDDVLDEWFRNPERWWKRDPAFDDHLRKRYGEDVEAGICGELDHWASTPRGALARNAVLGRGSTAEEIEFLKHDDSSFS